MPDRPTKPIVDGSPSTSSRAAKYRTIVADPPWDHSDGTGVHITVGLTGETRPDGPVVTTMPYSAMSIEEITALPVADLAESDAHLYLWVTNRYVRHAWTIAEAWGFTGACLLTWCKPASGWMPGGAWPSNTEFCLFARRGSLSAHGKAAGRWFQLPRRRGAPVGTNGHRIGGHSAKPEAFLDMVEAVSPGPYLELFARRQRLGWDTWGDQALDHLEMDYRRSGSGGLLAKATQLATNDSSGALTPDRFDHGIRLGRFEDTA